MFCRIIPAITLFLLAGCSAHFGHHTIGCKSPYSDLSSLKEGDIVHLPTGVKVSKDQMINVLSGARIIYVSEVHDNIHSHNVQLEILKAIAERYPEKVAVGIEMLKRSSQEFADQWTSGKLDEKDFVRVWQKDWSDDFQYYRPVLHYVRDHKIPLLALHAPDDWLERMKGAESSGQQRVNEEGLPHMDVEDPYHRAHVKALFGKHPSGDRSFEPFYSIQVLWDESMATSIAEYLQSEQGQDKRILIFAGGNHIRYGFGIPRRVFRRIPLPYAIVLPEIVNVPEKQKHKIMSVTMPEVPLLQGDFAWIVSYEDLDDQKVFLGVMIRDTDDGLKVFGTLKDSTAEKAGLKKNDIITTLDGEPIEAKFDLTYLLGLKKPGEKGVIEVLRDNKPLSFEVTFQAHPW